MMKRTINEDESETRLSSASRYDEGVLYWLGLVVVLLFIAAALTGFLANMQQIGLLTFLVMSFVSACFATTYLLLRRFMIRPLSQKTRSIISKVLIHVVGIVIAGVAGAELAARGIALIGGSITEHRANFLPVGLTLTAALVIVDAGYQRLRRHAREIELREERTRRQAIKAELAALQARTDPHFLFNSLNTVAGLIEEDPQKASAVLHRLADLFRYALEGSRSETVPLHDELDAIRTYLEIQQIRFDDRLFWTVEVDESCETSRVPPLLLQPLVENAVIHGITPLDRPGSIHVKAHRSNGALVMEVADDGNGPGSSPKRGSQTSLADLEERLQLMYGPNATLQIPTSGPGYRARVEIREETEIP